LEHDIQDESARLMTWDQIRELESMGIAIGAHTQTHARLSTLPESRKREEIAACAERMAECLGHPIEAFAYPFGSAADYDERCKVLVQEAGFAYACSNRYGTNAAGQLDPWALRRIWIDATDSLLSFQRKVLGELDLLRFLDTRPALYARRLLNGITRR
jgi:peptidoglycan/xylan/chitin deacetylase (PgdA/CDA1 family)